MLPETLGGECRGEVRIGFQTFGQSKRTCSKGTAGQGVSITPAMKAPSQMRLSANLARVFKNVQLKLTVNQYYELHTKATLVASQLACPLTKDHWLHSLRFRHVPDVVNAKTCKPSPCSFYEDA